MNTPRLVRSIVTRHVADATEGARCCRACGRPWPCDVRTLATALDMQAAAPFGTESGRHLAAIRPSAARLNRLPMRALLEG